MTRKQFMTGLSYIGSAYNNYRVSYKCTGLCEQIGINSGRGRSYKNGFKRCRKCNKVFELVDRCPCCNHILRYSHRRNA